MRRALSHARSFVSNAATLDSYDYKAVERFANRGDTCEECESRKGIAACLDCDELFCDECYTLCHLVEPQSRHDRLRYPISAAEWNKFMGKGDGGSTVFSRPDSPAVVDNDGATVLFSPVASTVASSPHSARSDLEPSPTASATNFVSGSRVYSVLVYGESVGIQLEEVAGRGFVVKGFDTTWNHDACPDVELGDVVIGAGHHDIRGLSLADAMGVIHACGVPRALRLRKDPPELVARSKVESDKTISITSTVFSVVFLTAELGLVVEWTAAGLTVRGVDAAADATVRQTVAPGDYIVSVNAVVLDGMSKARALDTLLSAAVPRVIQFRRLVRHIHFADWALNGPAELGAPKDLTGPLSPDVGRVLTISGQPFKVQPDGLVRISGDADDTADGGGGGGGGDGSGDGSGGDDGSGPAPTVVASQGPSPLKSALKSPLRASDWKQDPLLSVVASHQVLSGGGAGDSQYLTLGATGAVGKMKAVFKAEEIAKAQAVTLKAAHASEDSRHQAASPVTDHGETKAAGEPDDEPPPSPSSSFRVHSTRFPYLIPVPTIDERDAEVPADSDGGGGRTRSSVSPSRLPPGSRRHRGGNRRQSPPSRAAPSPQASAVPPVAPVPGPSAAAAAASVQSLPSGTSMDAAMIVQSGLTSTTLARQGGGGALVVGNSGSTTQHGSSSALISTSGAAGGGRVAPSSSHGGGVVVDDGGGSSEDDDFFPSGLISLSQQSRRRRRYREPPVNDSLVSLDGSVAPSATATSTDAWYSTGEKPKELAVSSSKYKPATAAGGVTDPDAPPPSKWWMPLVETLITRKPDAKSAPRFQPNDKVMFFTRERAAGPMYTLGRITAPRSYMRARRGKMSGYYYQVTWTDYTLVRDVPDRELTPRSFEKLRQVRDRRGGGGA